MMSILNLILLIFPLTLLHSEHCFECSRVKNISCGSSLELPYLGSSKKGPQYMFDGKLTDFLRIVIKNPSYRELCYYV